MPVPGGGAPRWQLALLLGAPLAIGLGYLYLRRRASPASAPPASVCASVSLDDAQRPARADDGESLDLALRYKVQGNKAFHAADYDEAATLYERAIAACPPDRPLELATFYQNRSACHEKREQWDRVRADCTEALRLNGKYVRAFLRRARAAEKSGDLAAALEDMTAACILEQFKERSTLVNTDRVLKALGKRRAREAMSSAETTPPSSRFFKAYFASFARDPAISGPDPAESPYADARRALRNDDILGAEAECDREIDDNGRYALEARVLRGTLLMLRSRNDDALADLTVVVEDERTPPALKANALVKRATLHLQSEEPAAVAADFDEAMLVAPEDGDVRFHRGQAFMLGGHIAEAKREFAEAARLNPKSAVARVQLRYAEYSEAKITGRPVDPAEIVANFEKVVREFPDCPEVYILFAEVLADLESFTRAAEVFDQAIEKDPGNANAYVHKGILELKRSGDVDKAVALVREAIRVDDKCLFAYETLGTVEVQRDNLEQAIALFEKAVELTRTETEMTHIFSLRDAARAQLNVAERWGISALKIGD